MLGVFRDVVLILAGLAMVMLFGVPLASFLYVTHFDPTWDLFVVEIRNQSDAEIVEAVADACAHQLRATGIASGGAVAMRFRVDCEGGYRVRVRLASGQAFASDELYITGGMRQHGIFTVTADRLLDQTRSLSEADLAAARR